MLKSIFAAAILASSALISAASPVRPCDRMWEQVALAASTSSAASPAATTSPAQIKALQEALILAASEQDRQRILLPNPPDASNITYQFVNNSVKAPTGGTIGLAGVDQFPALIGTKVGAAVGFVNPCGLNVPHLHPRANEFLIVTTGQLTAGVIPEMNPGGAGNINGVNPTGPLPVFNTTLSNYKGMLFPQGTVHFQFNPTCEPAVFVAAFDNSDPGRTQVATNFFSIVPDDVLIAATGGDLETLDARRIDQLRGKIPRAFAELIGSCAKRCGISAS